MEMNKIVNARQDRQHKRAAFTYISYNVRIFYNTNFRLAHKTNA
jgi:hypothetical protein